MIDFSRNHFELLGVPERFQQDASYLDQAYRNLQSAVHPDRFAAGAAAEQHLAVQSSARVNEAYRALKNPLERALYLLQLHGVTALAETDTSMPSGFLLEQLERREQLDDAFAARDSQALSAMLKAVEQEAREIERRLAHEIDALHAWQDAGITARELTFLRKLVDDIDARLHQLDD